MTNVRCTRCGALNLDTAQVCKVCQIEIRPPFAWPPQRSATWQSGTIKSTTTQLIRPFYGVGDVLGPTFSLFTGNFWLIAKFTVVIVAPFEIFKVFSGAGGIDVDWQLTTGTFFLDLLCKVLIAPALIYALMQVMETGTAPGVNESYRWGASKLGKLIVCAVMAWILQGFGFAMCFIPGIIVGLALVMVYPLAVLENGSPTNILWRSNELTKGHLGKIFGAMLVVWLLMFAVSIPSEGALAFVGLRGTTVGWPIQVAVAIFVDIIEQATTVLSLVIYLSIRALWSQGTQ